LPNKFIGFDGVLKLDEFVESAVFMAASPQRKLPFFEWIVGDEVKEKIPVVLSVIDSEKVCGSIGKETPYCGGGKREIVLFEEMAFFEGPNSKSLVRGEGKKKRKFCRCNSREDEVCGIRGTVSRPGWNPSFQRFS